MEKKPASKIGKILTGAAIAAGAIGEPGCDAPNMRDTAVTAPEVTYASDFSALASEAVGLLSLSNASKFVTKCSQELATDGTISGSQIMHDDGVLRPAIDYALYVDFVIDPEKLESFMRKHHDVIASYKKEHTPFNVRGPEGDIDIIGKLIQAHLTAKLEMHGAFAEVMPHNASAQLAIKIQPGYFDISSEKSFVRAEDTFLFKFNSGDSDPLLDMLRRDQDFRELMRQNPPRISTQGGKLDVSPENKCIDLHEIHQNVPSNGLISTHDKSWGEQFAKSGEATAKNHRNI